MHRILLNRLIQPFQEPERVIGFFNAYRNAARVNSQLSARYRPAISELAQEPLAKRLVSEGVDFKLQCSNAFLKCSNPGKLQEGVSVTA